MKSGFDARGSIQLPVLKRIRALSAAIFPPIGHAAEGQVPDAQGLLEARQDERRARLCAGEDAEADAEAHEEADAEAGRDGHADADAAETVTPEPTPEETPAP